MRPMTKKKQEGVIESLLGNAFKSASAGRGVPVLELGAIFQAGRKAFDEAGGHLIFKGESSGEWVAVVMGSVRQAMATAVDAAIAKAAGERFVIEAVADR